MPLVRIDLPNTTAPEHHAAVVEVVYRALVDVAGAPVDDKFMVVTEHAAGALVLHPTYLLERTPQALIIQITLNGGRSVQVKKDLYRAIADGIHAQTGIPTGDVFINLVEVAKENWSFGGGEAQYAD